MALKLPDVPQACKVIMVGVTQTMPFANTFYLGYSGGTPSGGDLNTVAQNIGNAWNTNLAPMVTAATQLTGVTVQDISSRTGAVGTNTTVRTGSGAGTSPPPTSACAVISWKVAYRFRGGHPRMYFPLRNMGDTSNGHLLTSTFITAMGSAATAFLTAVNAISVSAINYHMIMVSYFTNDGQGHIILHPDGPHKYDITSATIHGRVDSQRRRLGKEVA